MPLPWGNIRIKHVVAAGHLFATLLLVSTCEMNGREAASNEVVHYSGRAFAGSQTCASCHPAIAEEHSKTPHFRTSRPADTTTVKGSFHSGDNVYKVNDRLSVVMEQTTAGLFQTAYLDSVEINKKQMDITIGSGRKGQTYLYWDSNALFQLPVSYYAPSGVWCNSPGYPTDQVLFNRNIQARCLECHSTFFRTERSSLQAETFNKEQVVLGVDCERCHGPAADHVSFHRKFPGEKVAKHIVNPERLTRQQRLDNCALCHSGIRDNFMPSFTFLVGDRLDDFLSPVFLDQNAASLDVHGNQYGLLSASKCFQKSDMDCSSCHDVHAVETNRLEIFSARCMNCHSRNDAHFCKQPEVAGLTLEKNCIDCHMPALPSGKVFLQAPDTFQTTPFYIRTHLITSYRTQIEQFLERITSEESTR